MNTSLFYESYYPYWILTVVHCRRKLRLEFKKNGVCILSFIEFNLNSRSFQNENAELKKVLDQIETILAGPPKTSPIFVETVKNAVGGVLTFVDNRLFFDFPFQKNEYKNPDNHDVYNQLNPNQPYDPIVNPVLGSNWFPEDPNQSHDISRMGVF